MPRESANWSQSQAAEASTSQHYDDICRRFELSWQELQPPRIDKVVAEVAAGSQRPLLLKLIPVDIDGRWRYAQSAETVDRSGDDSQPADPLPLRPRLEDYVRRFSELLRLDELPSELIAHEYRVRHRWGDRPDHSEYLSRFESQADSILPSLAVIDGELGRAHAGDTWSLHPEQLAREQPVQKQHLARQFPDVPGYELLDVLGRGGMGVVYRARQTRLNRIVALKMILAGQLATPADISRFRAEAEAAAKLDHVGIVPIFEVGGDGENHFFSMGYVEGKNLADRLARGPLSPRDAAATVERIAVAVEYAHRHGIIHRDLKPRNILLTADGQPKITDFGLAKDLDADQAQTATGQILGTPGYMSPEQARGKVSTIGPRSDVYSLGAILYCLLTARPPFQAEGVIETLRQVVECEPVSPRLLNPAVSRDLETICLRCLAKNPEHRLASAQDLADELGRVLRGEPIRSRRIGPVSRAWRWVRRKPLAAALCAAVVVLCATLWAAGHLATRVSRSQELAGLLGEFEQQLDRLTLSEEQLTSLDALAARIEKLSADRAEQAKTRLNQSFAEQIEQALRAPKLVGEELAAIDGAIGLLRRRDPLRADELHAALDQRRFQWQTVVDLRPPFKGVEDVFGAAVAIDDQRRTLMLKNVQEQNDLRVRRLLTGVACEGDAQLEATFATSWQAANEVGLALDATDEGGYSFVLRLPPPRKVDDAEEAAPAALQSFAAARAAGGQVIEEVRRNGVALVRRSRAVSDLADGPLRLSAHRQRDELFFQVNALPPLRFFDPFMLASGSGVFGVRWPSGAALTSLRTQNRSQPLRDSALEGADRAFDEGRFSDAFALYQTQLVTGADEQYRQEVRYKSALCLAALNRKDEADAVFEGLLGEAGDRWPALAGCQLWVARLRQHRDVEAEMVFENLSGRFSVEQLAALTPADVREEILKSYSSEFNSLDNVLRFTPKRVEHAERALAIERFLNAESGNFALRFDLMRAYEARGEFDRALELGVPLARQNPWDFHVQRRFLRLLCLAGKPQEALDAIDQLLKGAPAEAVGFRQVMLLERSRANAAAGDFDNAESDIDALLAQPLTEDYQREYLVSFAYLMQGLLRDRRGDLAGAREAWRTGYAKLKQLRDESQIALGSLLCLQIAASFAGELAQEDVSQAVEEGLKVIGASPFSRLAQQFVDRQTYVNVFLKIWESPRGRALAHDFVFDRLTTSQRYQLPLELAGAELVRQALFGGEVSLPQEDLVNGTVRDYYQALVERGTLGKAQLAQLGLAWKGISGGLGWAGAAPTLEADLRSRTAYLLAHRYLRLGRGADAEKLVRDAIAAAPQSPAAQLAQAELDLLAANRGTLLIESESPSPTGIILAPSGQEAVLIHVDRACQTALPPGKYRLLLSEPQSDLVMSPDEVEITTPWTRTARIAWRWKPAELGRSLPGLAPQPSAIAGLGRWQIETRDPRGSTSVARSPDGRQLAIGSFDGRVRLYSADTMSLTGMLAGHDLAVSSLAYQPGSELLASGSKDGTVRLWRMPEGRIERVLRGHQSAITCLAWSSDGRLLASAGDWHDRTWRLWKATGEWQGSADVGSDVRSVSIHPGGDWLATANHSNDVRLWHADGKAGPVLVGHTVEAHLVAFSPDGRWLATGGADKTVRFWDTTRWQTAEKLDVDSPATVLAWSQTGESLAIATESGSLGIHAAGDRSPRWQRKATGPVHSIDWTIDDKELTTGTHWGWVQSWQAADGETGAVAEWLAPQGTTVACSSDGRRFAVADYKGVSLGHAEGHFGPTIAAPGIGRLAFAAGNEFLASLNWQGRLQIWNAASGEPVWTSPDQAGAQRVFAFSADGRQIAACGDDRIVRMWTVAGQPVAELPQQDDAVLSLAFGPDGRYLAIGLGDHQKQVRLWHLQPPTPGPVLSGHPAGIETIAWRHDGQRLATAGHDNTLRIWDVDGRPGPVLDAKRGWVMSVAWSPDGERLASFGYDSRCRIWQADGTPGPTLEGSLAPYCSVTFNTATGNLLLLGRDSTIRSYRPADGRLLQTTLLLPSGKSVVIGDGGKIASESVKADNELLYVVETSKRGFRLLSPDEFRQEVERAASQAAAGTESFPETGATGRPSHD